MSTEPSQIAKDAALDCWYTAINFKNPEAGNAMMAKIQSAIDQACAEKDQEIARLKQCIDGFGDPAIIIEGLDQRIAELEACIKKELDIAEEWQAMYALLDRVPHKRRHYIGTECWPNCPACAWAKLKEGK